ncbi:hypothetical protein [Burkholderia sp. B21-007]|uniref:hypothetical protein n=1 Tax=Burkholderia sp. B21-007 TaxID=2890407 RepID=UPI001E643DFA|nr:hypothetical protein [Burkholderia sp. B21-007]UEP31569.1 hypothetical protein LMA01_20390 [Burkholderia sp. B21-007]
MIEIEKMKALVSEIRYLSKGRAMGMTLASALYQAADAIDTLLSELEALIHDNGQLVKAASAEATLVDQLRIELEAHADFRQSVLDPENQPSQHGTILLDTHEKEVSRLRAELEAREADRRDAELWRKWWKWAYNLNRKPFELARDCDRYVASVQREGGGKI